MKQVETVWSDIDPRFITDGLGNIKKVTNIGAVLSSIDNILRTRKGERVMLRSFGSRLHSMVFESIDGTMSKMIAHEVRDAIERWDNRVAVQSVRVLTDPEINTVTVALAFSIRGYGSQIFQHDVLFKGR